MADWVLFLHVLAAFLLFGTVVIFSAVAFGAPPLPRLMSVANVCWNIGGIGTLIFGVWLALDLSHVEIWDGWVIGAIVLWALATETGRRAALELAAPAAGAVGTGERGPAVMHWVRTILVVALVVVMVYKPGA